MPCIHCPHCQKFEQSNSAAARLTIKMEIEHIVKLDVGQSPLANSVLRRLNSNRSATRNLPLEVLAQIFLGIAPVDITSRTLRLYRKEDYPDERENFTPILLQAVCSQWYHAARSTPGLWTSLILHVADVKDVHSKISILEMYLANATDHSFSLELNLNKQNLPVSATNKLGGNMSGVYDPEGYALLEPFYSIIFEKSENSRRIKVLRLSEVPIAWCILPFGNFSRLEELRLGSEGKCHDYEPMPRVFANLELTPLKRLLVKNTWLIHAPDRLNQIHSITILNLFRVDIQNCYRSLLLFPNLIEFRARECYYCTPYEITLRDLDLNKNFTLSRLEVLEWCFRPNTLNRAFLEHARLPVLRTFGWGGSIARNEMTSLRAFFRRLPSSLLTLELVEVEIKHESECRAFGGSLKLLAYVRKLTVLQSSLQWHTVRIFEALCPEETLPSLQEVYLVNQSNIKEGPGEYEEVNQQLNQRVRSQILNMLEERTKNSVNPSASFTLNTVNLDLSWEPSDGKSVRGMVEAGLDLQILQDGQLLQNLYEDSGDDDDIRKTSYDDGDDGDDSQDEDYSPPSSDDEYESDYSSGTPDGDGWDDSEGWSH
ncbi:hypothetical protein NP233_g7707 [Leucocoprinus birnbaumii]|uniref:F-box domain-containing protein n=1 Tax=Leucocoprinus birnbaumii TaxID=56174 RepID=A0AAD5YSI3_9AGAR|nr:hypothetical protein NP233_g7707 [Leucocoprinus birnbaumii]